MEAHVRFHVLVERLNEGAHLGHVLGPQKLIHHGLQECLLGFDAAQVAVRVAPCDAVFPVVVAVAEDLHGVVPAEKAVARRLVDMEILIGVVVVHVLGHVEVHAADGVHDLPHGVPFHHHLEVRLEAHQLGNLLVEVLDAPLASAVVIIDGVDPLDVPGDVHHGIPGDGHDGGLLVRHVVAGQQHGVRISAAAGIPAQDQDGPVILALPLSIAATGPEALAVVNGLRPVGLAVPIHVHGILRVVPDRQLRPDEEAPQGQRHRQSNGQNHNHHNQNDLLAGQLPLPGGLWLLPAGRQPPSGVTWASRWAPAAFQYRSCYSLCPFTASLASRVLGWMGAFRPSISPMVISRPSSRPASKSS